MTPEQQNKVNDLQDDLDTARERGIPLGTIHDGVKSFSQLYRESMVLFMALCKTQNKYAYADVWMTRVESDGTPVADGWFILGLNKKAGRQITYHIPMSDWDSCRKFAKELAKAPEFDGHTAADVLTRLAAL